MSPSCTQVWGQSPSTRTSHSTRALSAHSQHSNMQSKKECGKQNAPLRSAEPSIVTGMGHDEAKNAPLRHPPTHVLHALWDPAVHVKKSAAKSPLASPSKSP
eukprot:6463733-Amphidinium_carterae.1